MVIRRLKGGSSPSGAQNTESAAPVKRHPSLTRLPQAPFPTASASAFGRPDLRFPDLRLPDLRLPTLGQAFAPAVLAVMLGLAVGTAPASAASKSESVRGAGIQVQQVEFDWRDELSRLGVGDYAHLSLDFDSMRALVDQINPAKREFGTPFKKPPPTVSITYDSGVPGRPTTELIAHAFSSFDPDQSHDPSVLKDQALATWLKTPEPGESWNIENSDLEAVQNKMMARIAQHPEWLAEVGADSITNLTPRQAALIASRLTTDLMEYNGSALDYEGGLDPFTHLAIDKLAAVDSELANRYRASLPKSLRDDIQRMDVRPIQELFDVQTTTENPLGETGVCRNYTEVFQALFESLKAVQDQPNALTHTFVKQVNADNHVYNALFVPRSDGTLGFTVLDPTRADSMSTMSSDAFVSRLGESWGFAFAFSKLPDTVANLHAATVGSPKPEVFSDFMLVWLRAISLGSEGRAADGLALLDGFVDSVPGPHGNVMRNFTYGLMSRDYNTGWWPEGKRELMAERHQRSANR